MPRADVDVALRAADRLGDLGQRVLAVDQHLELVALARRRAGLCPQSLGRRRERAQLVVAAQAPHVVVDHRALDPVADRGVETVEDLHAAPVPASLRSMASDQPTPQRLAAIREQMSLLSDYL